MTDYIQHLPDITRVDVIDEQGLAYTGWNLNDVRLVIQDDGRTLKVIVNRDPQEG